MTKSSVVDNETGKSMDSTVRTSTGTFFARGQDEVLANVEKRIAQVCSEPSCSREPFHFVCILVCAQLKWVQECAIINCCCATSCVTASSRAGEACLASLLDVDVACNH